MQWNDERKKIIYSLNSCLIRWLGIGEGMWKKFEVGKRSWIRGGGECKGKGQGQGQG